MKRQQHLAVEIFELALGGSERDKRHAENLIRKLTAEARRDVRAACQLVDELLDDCFLAESRERRARKL